MHRTTGCSVIRAKCETKNDRVEAWRSRSWIVGVFVSYDKKLRLYHIENGRILQDFKRKSNMVRYAF